MNFFSVQILVTHLWPNHSIDELLLYNKRNHWGKLRNIILSYCSVLSYFVFVSVRFKGMKVDGPWKKRSCVSGRSDKIVNSLYRITLRSIQTRAPSGEIVFPDFSSTWVIFSSRLDLVKEIITRFCVSRGKITHIDEKSGKTISPLGARVWIERRVIL